MFLERRKCVHCGEELLIELMTMNKDGNWVCLICLNELYIKCEGQCEDFVLNEDIKYTSNGLVCRECREENGSRYE